MVYGQTEVTRDLMDARAAAGLQTVYEAGDVRRARLRQQPAPRHLRHKDGQAHELAVRLHRRLRRLPRRVPRQRAARRHPRVREGLPLRLAGPAVRHAAGARRADLREQPSAASRCARMRSQTRSRYYLQVPLTDKVEDWTDEAFWDELRLRLDPRGARAAGHRPVASRRASRRCAASSPSRCASAACSWPATPAHIVPPTGAKGLNLAATDVKYLSNALHRVLPATSSEAGIDSYSERCLRRIWHAERFSWWFTNADAPLPGRRRHRPEAAGGRAGLPAQLARPARAPSPRTTSACRWTSAIASATPGRHAPGVRPALACGVRLAFRC